MVATDIGDECSDLHTRDCDTTDIVRTFIFYIFSSLSNVDKSHAQKTLGRPIAPSAVMPTG